MFVREKSRRYKDKTYTYLQLVENRWVNGRTKQKVLLTLGRKDQLDRSRMDEIVSTLKDLTTDKLKVISKAEELDLEARKARRWGDLLVLDRLWKEVKLDQIIKHHLKERKFEMDVEGAIKAMVFNRLCDPRSKLGTYRWIKRHAYFPEGDSLKLQHLYRALDFLWEVKEEVEKDLYLSLANLFNLDLSIVFYDTTLVSYQGEGPKTLCTWSRRKEWDFLLGLALTRDGMPFAHQVMPGNTTDSTTLKEWVKKLTQRFKIGRCIICADRGIITQENLKFLEKEGIPYLAGMKLRNLKEVNQEVLSTGGRYRKVADNLKVKETKTGDKRYLICFNPQEARRRRKEREEIIRNLKEEIQTLRPKKEGHTKRICSLLSHKLKGKFLKELKDGSLKINSEKVREEERFDGKFVLRTSEENLPSEELALAYKELSRIEQSFRSMKSLVELEPVYHWTDPRVRAHVFICVLAHLLERVIERKLKQEGMDLSPQRILEALSELKAVEVTIEGKDYLLRTRPPQEVQKFFRILRMRLPKHIQEL